MSKQKMMIVGALTVAGAWCAQAETVSYLEPVFDSKGAVSGHETKSAECTPFYASGDSSTLVSGWYCVSAGVAVPKMLKIDGDVKIVLKNGASLFVNSEEERECGLNVESGNELTIYAQSTEKNRMGRIYAYGGGYAAGIGSGVERGEHQGAGERPDCGKITINGGWIMATGGTGAAGIGGGSHCNAEQGITINGGFVEVGGGHEGSAIGTGCWGNCKNITINGGTVMALGHDNDGAGIGIGQYSIDGSFTVPKHPDMARYTASYITINGGTVTATGHGTGAAIGGNRHGDADHITINGGTVTATSDGQGAGIGGGKWGAASYIAINNGTVTAQGGDGGGAGIGGGEEASGVHITVNNGTVDATGGEGAAGIGGGKFGNGEDITISYSRVTATGGKETARDYGNGGAGIGGGGGNKGRASQPSGNCKNVTITGGTVKATGGESTMVKMRALGIGGGASNDIREGYGTTENLVFAGASINSIDGVGCTPKNARNEPVYLTTVTGVEESPAQITGIPDYDANDLYPDNGNLYLWLPSGNYDFHSLTKIYSGSAGTTLNPSGEYYGVTVNGTEAGEGEGDGWTCADHVLTLSSATDYTLAGWDRVGRLRVQVTANATVTLDDLTLLLVADAPCFMFASGVKDAKLVLAGANKVYAQNGYPAVDIQPGAKVTLSGDGALVGGGAAGVNSRAVYNNGVLAMMGGTIRGYYTPWDGCAVYNNGTASIYGGTVVNNASGSRGGFCYCNDKCQTFIYGGYFSGNTASAEMKSNLYHGYGRQQNGYLYGGVFAADPTSQAESGDAGMGSCLELRNDAAVKQVGVNYLVGQGVEVLNDALVGGTYTFNPTNDEYAAAGVKMMGNCAVLPHEETTPKTYVVEKPADFHVNGASLSAGGGAGWTFDSETGLLSLTNAMEYALSGYCELPIKVDVTANAAVNLTDVRITSDALGRDVFNVTAPDVRFSLGGTNEIYTTGGHAAIGVGSGAKLTVDGDGALVGGKTVNATCLGVSVNGGTFVMNGGTISGYKGGSYGGGIYFANGMGELNAGAITDCSATYGGALVLWNSGTVNIQSGMAICGNSAVSHGAVFLQGGTINVWGGTFTGNDVTTGVLADWAGTLNVYGGVFVGKSVAPVYRSTVYGGVYDVIPEGVVSGFAATKLGDNWIVGQGVTQENDALTGGTYYFDPSCEEYAAAGVALANQYESQAQGTTPETYGVHFAACFTVDGVRLDEGTGQDGWTFDAEAGLLTLTAAQAYELKGYADLTLMIDVISNATVTLNEVRIRAGAIGRSIFNVTAADATFVLNGENTVYAADGSAAIGVAAGARLTVRGGGELIGGKASGACGRGFYVCVGGELAFNGGTIRDYRSADRGGAVYNAGTFTMAAGAISGCQGTEGGALFNKGTAAFYGGAVVNNEATSCGGFCYGDKGCRTDIYGGCFSGNAARRGKCNLYIGYRLQENGSLYGGVFAADPTDSEESIGCLLLQGDAAVTQVGDNWIVGKDVTQNDNAELTGGTCTFDPTEDAYAEAGVALAEERVVRAQATDPKTYAIDWNRTGFAVNGIDLIGPEDKSGLGWGYDKATGVLSLSEDRNYVLSGAFSRKGLDLGVTVDGAGATVVLSNATITSFALSPLMVNASGVNVQLAGANTLTAPAGFAAIAVPSGDVTIDHVRNAKACELVAVGGANAVAIGGEGNVTVEGGVVTAKGGVVGAKVEIKGGTVVAQGSGTDIGGNTVVVSGGSILAGNVTNPKNEGGEAVWCVTVPGVLHAGPVALSGINYGAADLYPIGGNLYLWLPNEDEYEIVVKDPDDEKLNEHFYATVNDGPAVAHHSTDKITLTVNGETVTPGGHGDWSYDEDSGVLTLQATANYYVLAGESLGGAVRILVEDSCTVALSGVQLGMGDEEGWEDPPNLFFVAAGEVEVVLDGTTAFQVAGDTAPIGIGDDATLKLSGQGRVRNWNVDLGDGARVTMEDPTTLLFMTEADATAAAETVEPCADEGDFPDVEQAAYAELFDVGVKVGSEAGTWVLDYKPTEDTKATVNSSFTAALTSLAQNLAAGKGPMTTVSGVAGLYYGIASAASQEGLASASVSSWTPSQGGETTISGSALPVSDAAFYQLRVTRKSGEAEVVSAVLERPDTGVTVDGKDLATVFGEGWSYADGVVTLNKSRAYVLSGENTTGAVRAEVTGTDAVVTFDNLTLSGLGNAAAVTVQSGAGLTLPGDGKLTGGKLLVVADGGAAEVLGGIFNGSAPFSADDGGTLTVYGCVSVDKEIDEDLIASGYACKEVGTEEGSNYVVGKDIKLNGEDQLIEGTYTFCPTNAQYEAAELYVEPGTLVTKKATTPVTWVLGVVYPGYMEGKSEAVKAKFKAWAKAYPPGDPDGIYANAFLLNVAQSREAEAVAAFKIGSVAVTNEVVGTVTNTLVVVERAQPLAPATMFNGDTWLQCATNGLGEADFLDIEGGRYTEEVKSFFIQRIDFEHTLTPEAFPTEPTSSKAMRVKVKEK